MTFQLAIFLAGLILLTTSSAALDTQQRDGAVKAVANSQTFPRFDRVLLLETTSDTSANVSIGDLNGDGNLDILLVKGRHWPLVSRVLLGDGRGHFAAAYNLAEVPYRSYSGRLVDMDGDGDLDVVLSNDTPDPKVIYMNDGKGHFRVGSAYGQAAWETRNASVADLNGDGQPDIVVANRTDKGANYICLNKGKGRFDADCVPFSHESATTITAADFNHDGLIDLAVPHRDGGQSYLYLASAQAVYSNLRRVPFGPTDAAIRMAEAADLNGDGLLDIVAIDERRGVAIYFGQKDGTFSSGVALDSGKVTPYALAASDLDRDGSLDIVVGNVNAPSTIYFNDASGRQYTPIHFGDNKGTVYGFAIADLDRDGLPDIAVARSDAPNAVFFASPARSKTATLPKAVMEGNNSVEVGVCSKPQHPVASLAVLY
ncbi:MAG TPA: VCBS repeat-containing protein [Pyrinomonadaceae bacterium]|nr:VCBS repeat-containing protein [Pyrinomonadaceae bacterium]